MLNIITVCFNDLKGLKATYTSIQDSLSQRVRWIVIDGCSTDGSLSYLDSLSSENIFIISEEDEGLYDAMNKGMKYASHGWIWFLNAGDTATQDAFSVLNFSTEEYDLIYGDAFDIVDDEMHFKKATNPKKNSRKMFTHHQSIFYSLSFLFSNKITYDLRYKIAADYDLTSKVLSLSPRIQYLSIPVCVFDTPRISKFSNESFREWMAIKRTYYGGYFVRLKYLELKLKFILKMKAPSLYYKFKNLKK